MKPYAALLPLVLIACSAPQRAAECAAAPAAVQALDTVTDALVADVNQGTAVNTMVADAIETIERLIGRTIVFQACANVPAPSASARLRAAMHSHR
jgi:hypothetical protein